MGRAGSGVVLVLVSGEFSGDGRFHVILMNERGKAWYRFGSSLGKFGKHLSRCFSSPVYSVCGFGKNISPPRCLCFIYPAYFDGKHLGPHVSIEHCSLQG